MTPTIKYTTKRLNTPQPDALSYGIEALYQFKKYNRASFLAEFGFEAPAYDPAKPIKKWADTGALLKADGAPSENPENEFITYTVWDDSDMLKQGFSVRSMTCLAAATFNLPGLVSYAKWQNTETTSAVMINTMTGQQTPVNGRFLSLPSIAEQIAAEISKELGVPVSAVENMAYKSQTNPFVIIYGSELRRQMSIIIEPAHQDAETFEASLLIENRYAQGVGVPGKWTRVGNASPQFVPEVPNSGEMDLRPPVPFPVRTLKANEEVLATPMGTGIRRKDILDSNIQKTGGGLTEQEHQCLFQILTVVNDLNSQA